MSKTIIVIGATGRQGGAVIEALKGSDFEILALTREKDSPAASRLIKSYPNVKIIEGNLDLDNHLIFEKAQAITRRPIWGVFAVLSKVSGADKSLEVKQGKLLITAAVDNHVKHFVYSSVDRGGERSSNNPTSVPHWATKHAIEKFLEQEAPRGGMSWTVLRPTALMEGLSNDFQGKSMAAAWKYHLKDKPMQLVASKDIGWFAADAFQHMDKYAGRFLSLAGAEVTYDQANNIFKGKFEKDLPTTYKFVTDLLLHVVKDIGDMFKYLKQEGTGADIYELRKINPYLMDLGTWFEEESQFRKTQV